MDPENNITCPICEEEFVDMRGLTSHARHKHGLKKEKVDKLFENKKGDDSVGWKILGGIGLFLISLVTLGKIR